MQQPLLVQRLQPEEVQRLGDRSPGLEHHVSDDADGGAGQRVRDDDAQSVRPTPVAASLVPTAISEPESRPGAGASPTTQISVFTIDCSSAGSVNIVEVVVKTHEPVIEVAVERANQGEDPRDDQHDADDPDRQARGTESPRILSRQPYDRGFFFRVGPMTTASVVVIGLLSSDMIPH